MSDFTLNVALDEASLAHIAHMAQAELMLNSALLASYPSALDEVQKAATEYMLGVFMHPTGEAETAWEQQIMSPFEAVLTNTSAYGQRLNYGFSGLTDSRGRYYPYWPAYHWAENAVEMSSPFVERIISDEMNMFVAGI
jgi:hypothetical protein